MTTEIEKQFFDTFGIEPYDRYYNCIDNLEGECTVENSCDCCDKSEDVYCYPEITDKILLHLICLLSNGLGGDLNIETLKKRIINDCIKFNNHKAVLNGYFKHQVQALFEEG